MKRELAYGLHVLYEKKKWLEEFGPRTEHWSKYQQCIRALDITMALIEQPRFEINPFV